MKRLNQKNLRSVSLLVLVIGILFVFQVELQPVSSTNSTYGYYEDTSRIKRFQLEIYGGFAILDLKDLNLFVDHDDRLQNFSYDLFLQYLENTNQIIGWMKNQEEGRKKIKNSIPFGFRLKYRLNQTFGFSLGLKSLINGQESQFGTQYIRTDSYGDQHMDDISCDIYSLSANALVPMLGVHVTKKIFNNAALEGFISAGPIFAECRYFSKWLYEWHYINPGWLVFRNWGELEEKGQGTGIALELGGQIQVSLMSWLNVFIESGYAYQVVKNISGPGRESFMDKVTNWDGEWAIKEDIVSGVWGSMETEFPTNFWPERSNYGKVRDFKLDFSGFQFRFGLAFAF